MNLLLRIKTEKSQMTLDSISESWFMSLPCYICSVYKEKMLHFWRMLECIFVLIVVPLICIWAIWQSISKSWAWVPPEFHIFVYILYSSWALDFRTRGHKVKVLRWASMTSKPKYEDMNKVGNDNRMDVELSHVLGQKW